MDIDQTISIMSETKLSKHEIQTIERLIEEEFAIHRYVKQKHIIKWASKMYVWGCIAGSTEIFLTKSNHQVIGILMGRINQDVRLSRVLFAMFRYWFYQLLILLTAFSDLRGMMTYSNIQSSYLKMLKKRNQAYQAELTLLIVDHHFQGQGIGSRLVDSFNQRLESKQVDHYYLFTDTESTYHFYQKTGFQLVGEEQILVSLDGKKQPMKIFLYDYTVNVSVKSDEI